LKNKDIQISGEFLGAEYEVMVMKDVSKSDMVSESDFIEETEADTKNEEDTNTGEIVGIVLGVIFGILFIVLCIAGGLYLRKKKIEKEMHMKEHIEAVKQTEQVYSMEEVQGVPYHQDDTRNIPVADNMLEGDKNKNN